MDYVFIFLILIGLHIGIAFVVWGAMLVYGIWEIINDRLK